MHPKTTLPLFALSAFLCACGNSGTSTTNTPPAVASPGALVYSSPLRVASLSASDFAAQLGATASGAQLLQIAGTPACGIDVHYLQYGTLGGAGEATTASGALMIPTGSSPQCSGPRPIVVYAHGTTISKNYNIADITNPNNPASGETGLIAAMYAAQGYIVVAPNYAGYDSSPLPYHPYLNAQQQGGEIVHVLKAARAALPNTPAGATTTDGGKLFVTGYSQGGHVAMAGLRALQAANIPVTAGAPLSGPYAMEYFGDAIFGGNVNVGGTVFAPLLATGYQKSYGNLYSATTDVYNPMYASNIETLLPGSLSEDDLFGKGYLPQAALFQSNTGIPTIDAVSPASPAFAYGFDHTNYLIQTAYRGAYLADANTNQDQQVAPATSPANPLRIDLKKNDLRGYSPSMPVLMCGGGDDPTVFYAVNTSTMAASFGLLGTPAYAVLDVDTGSTNDTNPKFSSVGLTTAQLNAMKANAPSAQKIFAIGKSNYADAVSVARHYHADIVAPACTFAARSFFNLF